MIYSGIKELHNYKGLNKNLDKAIEYLESTSLETLEEGKFFIDEENVYGVVSLYSTRSEKEGKYETHNNYLDIQLLIQGEEIILITHRDNLTSTGYKEDIDKENYEDGKDYGSILLCDQNALILFPEDAHKACCMVDNERLNVKKLLLKVKI